MRLSLSDETNNDFRLLVAEIADQEGLAWPQAVERARVVWADVRSHDPNAPIPFRPRRDWRFIAWLLFLVLIISLALNGVLIWILLGGIAWSI